MYLSSPPRTGTVTSETKQNTRYISNQNLLVAELFSSDLAEYVADGKKKRKDNKKNPKASTPKNSKKIDKRKTSFETQVRCTCIFSPSLLPYTPFTFAHRFPCARTLQYKRQMHANLAKGIMAMAEEERQEKVASISSLIHVGLVEQ